MNKSKMLSMLVGMTLLATGSVGAVDVYELNPVLVTAQRTEKEELRTAATMYVVTKKEIKDVAAASTYDTLLRVVGMSSYSYAEGYGSTGSSVARVYLRGLDKGTLIMVNGTPLNQMNYGTPEGIPEDAIERIEVVKGSNSVLYGAEAMGGVVNIITKKPEKGAKPEIVFTGGLGNHAKHAGISVTGDGYIFSYQKKFIPAHWDAQVPYIDKKYKDFPIYSYINNLKKRKMENIFASIKLSDEWTLNWTRHKSYSGTIYKSISEPGIFSNEKGVSDYSYQETRDNIGFQYRDDGGLQGSLAFNTKQTLTNAMRKDGRPHIVGNGSNYRVNNYYGDVQKELPMGNNHLIVGAMAYREEYKEIRSGTGNAIGRNQLAVFGSYEWNPSETLSITLGARQHFSLDNGWDPAQSVFLPQIQTSAMLRPNLNWYINIGKSFEMPAINNKYSSYKKAPIKAAIKPQQGWTYETGLKWIDDKHTVKLAAFYMDVDNMFGWEKIKNLIPNYEEQNLDGESYLQINRGHFENKGIELEYRQITGDHFNWYAGIIFQDPKTRKTNKDKWAQLEARIQARFGFGYQQDKWAWTVDGFIEADRQKHGRKKDYKRSQIPSRFSLNSNIHYAYSDRTSFDLSFRNLLNRDNYTGLYLWRERPRSVLLSMTHRF